VSDEAQSEALREWLVDLSELIGGELERDSSLETGLSWFGDLGDSTLSQVWALGKDNPAIESFLASGHALMSAVATG